MLPFTSSLNTSRGVRTNEIRIDRQMAWAAPTHFCDVWSASWGHCHFSSFNSSGLIHPSAPPRSSVDTIRPAICQFCVPTRDCGAQLASGATWIQSCSLQAKLNNPTHNRWNCVFAIPLHSPLPITLSLSVTLRQGPPGSTASIKTVTGIH